MVHVMLINNFFIYLEKRSSNLAERKVNYFNFFTRLLNFLLFFLLNLRISHGENLDQELC